MPKAKQNLPSTLERSDAHAQRLFTKARASAEKTYGGDSGRAARVAYAALKHEYMKKGDRWVRKAERGPSDPQAARGPTTPVKSTDPRKAPTARGRVAGTPAAARRAARESSKEYSRARAKEAGNKGRSAAQKSQRQKSKQGS